MFNQAVSWLCYVVIMSHQSAVQCSEKDCCRILSAVDVEQYTEEEISAIQHIAVHLITVQCNAAQMTYLLSYFERILTVSFLCASTGSTGAFSPLPDGSASLI
jgi:hypothetical protein